MTWVVLAKTWGGRDCPWGNLSSCLSPLCCYMFLTFKEPGSSFPSPRPIYSPHPLKRRDRCPFFHAPQLPPHIRLTLGPSSQGEVAQEGAHFRSFMGRHPLGPHLWNGRVTPGQHVSEWALQRSGLRGRGSNMSKLEQQNRCTNARCVLPCIMRTFFA